jgi:hypothetical protein
VIELAITKVHDEQRFPILGNVDVTEPDGTVGLDKRILELCSGVQLCQVRFGLRENDGGVGQNWVDTCTRSQIYERGRGAGDVDRARAYCTKR